jgi:hypothetical protein
MASAPRSRKYSDNGVYGELPWAISQAIIPTTLSSGARLFGQGTRLLHRLHGESCKLRIPRQRGTGLRRWLAHRPVDPPRTLPGRRVQEHHGASSHRRDPGLIGMALLPVGPSIACLFAYMAVMAFAAPATFAIPHILAGPVAAGRWVGVQSTCGNLAGVFASFITGVLIDATGNFQSAFVAAAVINVLGIVGWVYILPPVRPIPWAGVSPVSLKAATALDVEG